MNSLKIIFLLFALSNTSMSQFPPVTSSVGQKYPLPAFDLNRANDSNYVRSTVNLAHNLISKEKKLPLNPIRDSTILRLYNYLGAMYRETKNNKDNALFYGKKMVEFARECRIMEFEVKGLFQQALYYRNIKLDSEEALRLNLRAYRLVENANHDPQVFWRICYNLGDLYLGINDNENALKYFKQSEILIKEGTGLSKVSTEAYNVSIWQGIANIYLKLEEFNLSEKYFLKALERLKIVSIKSSHANIYNDYAMFCKKQGRFLEAVEFSKKAEEIWIALGKIENVSSTKAELASNYLELDNVVLAQQNAEAVFRLSASSFTGRKNAYYVLYKVNLKNGNWLESLSNFEKYIATRDTLESKFKSEELYKIQSHFDLERLELRNNQIKELQDQEILSLKQKSEFEKLKTDTERQSFLDNSIREKLKSEIETQKLKEQASIQNKLNFE